MRFIKILACTILMVPVVAFGVWLLMYPPLKLIGIVMWLLSAMSLALLFVFVVCDNNLLQIPETHKQGYIEVSNEYMAILPGRVKTIKGDFGIQVVKDGRVWICINGTSFVRFKPEVKS